MLSDLVQQIYGFELGSIGWLGCSWDLEIILSVDILLIDLGGRPESGKEFPELRLYGFTYYEKKVSLSRGLFGILALVYPYVLF